MIMRSHLRLLLLIACLCSTAANGQTKSINRVDPSIYVVFSLDKTNDIVFRNSNHPKPTTLSQSEVDDIESFVVSAYRQFQKKVFLL
jgi:hypothetical protein